MLNNFLDKVWLGLKSRTVWTFIVLFVINGVSGIHDMLPQQAISILDIVLPVLGSYFRVNPKV